jgi:glycosyltransferase involved in cell wall biosynthesis
MTEGGTLSYAVVTPVRNEEANLQRFADCLDAQTARPASWIIIDTGSDDQTAVVAGQLAAQTVWTRVLSFSDDQASGEPIVVRAFQAGLAELREHVDVIVKADADISFDPSYFELLLCRFADDPSLGIASGTCVEKLKGTWRARHVTGDHVWGASRAYRAACLAEVSPLEERLGWDGIDTFKARARGWRTKTIEDLFFRHHRPEGRRNGRWAGWSSRGRAAHYMGYRPAFLVLRALYQSRRDPLALAIIFGWAGAALRREPRCPDPAVSVLLRQQQRLRELSARALEARGRRRMPARQLRA